MDKDMVIGRVTRCSTRGYSGAYPLEGDRIPSFGTFCAAAFREGAYVIGAVYDINIEDDPLARQLAVLEDVPEEHILDSQYNRQIPVEFSIVSLGYMDEQGSHHTLPPRPPMTLESIQLLAQAEIVSFTSDLSFLSTITFNPVLPVDELLIACTLEAVGARPEKERHRYLLQVGRTLARIHAGDLHRLNQILSKISRSQILPSTEA